MTRMDGRQLAAVLEALDRWMKSARPPTVTLKLRRGPEADAEVVSAVVGIAQPQRVEGVGLLVQGLPSSIVDAAYRLAAGHNAWLHGISFSSAPPAGLEGLSTVTTQVVIDTLYARKERHRLAGKQTVLHLPADAVLVEVAGGVRRIEMQGYHTLPMVA